MWNLGISRPRGVGDNHPTVQLGIRGGRADGVIVGARDAHHRRSFARDSIGTRYRHPRPHIHAAPQPLLACRTRHGPPVIPLTRAHEHRPFGNPSLRTKPRNREPCTEPLERRQPEPRRLVLQPEGPDSQLLRERGCSVQRRGRQRGLRREMRALHPHLVIREEPPRRVTAPHLRR